MEKLARTIDGLNTGIATVVRWLALFMVLMQFTIVVGRYAFGLNSIALQESVLYMHATLFMLGAGYTLLVDKHVRVDVFYAKLNGLSDVLVETEKYEKYKQDNVCPEAVMP